MTTTEADLAGVRIARHFDRSIIQPEDTLRRDLRTWTQHLEKATGIRLNINVNRILEAAAMIAGPS